MKFLASALVLAQVQVFAQSVVGSSGLLVGAPVYSPSLTSYVGQSAPVVLEGKLYTPPLTSVYTPIATTTTGQVYLPASTATTGQVYLPASTAVRTTFPYTASAPLPIASTNFVASTGFQVNAAPATAQKGQPTPWITQTFNPSLFPQATTNVSLPGAIPYTPAVPVSQTTALQQSGARPTFTTYSSPAVVSSSSYSPVTATFPQALSVAQSTIPSATYVPSTVFPSSAITIPNSAVVPASFTGATTVFPPASSSAVVPTYVGAATTTTTTVFPPASSGVTNSAVFTGATTFPATTSTGFPATTSTGFPAASNTFNAQATASSSSSFPTFTGSANVGAAASAGAGTGDDYYYD